MSNFFGDHWSELITLCIALIGVAGGLPQLYKYASYHLFKRKIEFYPSESISVSYNVFGPCISILSTLRAINRPSFIKSILLEITREEDRLTHVFEWAALMKPSFMFPPLPLNFESLECAMSLLANPDQPLTYNYIFGDSETFKKLIKMPPEANRILMTLCDQNPKREDETILDYSERIRVLFNQSTTEMYTKMTKLFYWNPGKYLVKLKIEFSDKIQIYQKEYVFEINQGNSDDLELNIIVIKSNLVNTFFNLRSNQEYFVIVDFKEVIQKSSVKQEG